MPSVVVIARPRDQLVQALEPLLQRAPEALLLGGHPAADRVALRAELGVLRAHQLGDDVGVALQKPGLQAQPAAVLDGAAHDAAQDVAAVLVGGHHAVAEQERHRTAVVGEHPQRAVGGEVLVIAAAGQLLAQLDERRELVGLEHRRLALEDAGQAVEPQSGVDVLGRQRREHVDGVLVHLHEHEVPVLHEALVLPAGEVVGLAVVDAAVQVQLRARPARPERPGLPEVLRARALDDPLARDPDLQPGVDRLLVGPEAQLLIAREHGDPDVIGGEAEPLGRERPGKPGGLALEVVAEAEVAEHLEEREMAGGGADDLDVRRCETSSGRWSRAGAAGGSIPGEIRLERMHPRDREQRRGVDARTAPATPRAAAGGPGTRRTRGRRGGSRQRS